MEGDWTKAPWRKVWVEDEDGKGWEVFGPGDAEWIAECGRGGNAEDCADLIASAPDLFDALRYMLEFPAAPKAHECARRALAKALNQNGGRG